MKLTSTKQYKSTKHSWLLPGLLLSVVIFANGFMPVLAQAASPNATYQDVLNSLGGKQAKYCASLNGKPHYHDCLNEYGLGISAVYWGSSTAAVNKEILQTCTSPIINYPPSQLSDCAAFSQGTADTRTVLGLSNGSSSAGSGPSSSSSSQPASTQGKTGSQQTSSKNSQQATKPPPISDCSKAQNASDQKKCKQDYQDCNQPPYTVAHMNQCKTQVVTQATKNSGKNGKSAKAKQAQNNVNGNAVGNATSSPAGQGSNCSQNSSHCDLVALYINPFINLLSIVVGLIIAGSLILAGVQYSASSGDPQKTSAAKSRISNTLLALFAYAFMYAFLNFLVPGGVF